MKSRLFWICLMLLTKSSLYPAAYTQVPQSYNAYPTTYQQPYLAQQPAQPYATQPTMYTYFPQPYTANQPIQSYFVQQPAYTQAYATQPGVYTYFPQPYTVYSVAYVYSYNPLSINSDTSAEIVPPLHTACMNGDQNAAELLVNSRANVNQALKKEGLTPLLLAAYHGHEKIAELLLTSKADVDQCKTSGASPLLLAAQEGHLKTVELCIKAGGNVNCARKDDAITPLVIASINGHSEVTQSIINAHADIKPDALQKIIEYRAQKPLDRFEAIQELTEKRDEQCALILQIIINDYYNQLHRLHPIQTNENNNISLVPAKNAPGLHLLPREVIETLILPYLSPSEIAAFRRASTGCYTLACSQWNKYLRNHIKNMHNDFLKKGIGAAERDYAQNGCALTVLQDALEKNSPIAQ